MEKNKGWTIMFYDDPNVIKLDEEIFVYKGFFDKEYVDNINDVMSKFNFEVFAEQDPEHALNWYRDKLSPNLPEMLDASDKISAFLAPEFITHPNLSLQVIKPGDGGMFIHCDSPGEGNHEQLTSTDRWSTCCIITYGLVAYFGDFKGGEVFYPTLGIEYAPEPGDLVIHGAHSRTSHGVKEVTEGIRYAYSNFVMKSDRNPGSFYSYGTPEYEERKKNIDLFTTPLFENPQFCKN